MKVSCIPDIAFLIKMRSTCLFPHIVYKKNGYLNKDCALLVKFSYKNGKWFSYKNDMKKAMV